MTDPNNAQPPRQGVIKRTIGGSLARSWPPPLPRRRRCCVLLYRCWACLLLLLRTNRCHVVVASLLCAVCWKPSFTLRVRTARLVRSRTSTRSYQGMEPSNGRTIGGSHRPGNALGRSGPGFHRGCGVNPAVSRCAGPSSAWNERKRLGEPVLLFLRDTRTCTRNVRTVFTFK